ncbi:MAG: YicC family protein [Cyclobacteriaceae bacterium]
MLLSMTGFGAAEGSTQSHQIKVEIRTLNSKFLDINLRLPRELSEKELEIRNLIGQHLGRGKVNFAIDLTAVGLTEPTVQINEILFKSYYDEFLNLASKVGADTADVYKLALQSPDVITNRENAEIADWEGVKKVVIAALTACNDFRKQEGATLQGKLVGYIQVLKEALCEVKTQDEERIKQIKLRIKSSLDEIKDKVQVDQNRFEQELIYYIEKIDITEEKVRLAGHLDYFLEVMGDKDSQGKKLGFISQEIGREINTIGAKANDAVVQRAVVRMKDELEKIKEQSMNIL